MKEVDQYWAQFQLMLAKAEKEMPTSKIVITTFSFVPTRIFQDLNFSLVDTRTTSLAVVSSFTKVLLAVYVLVALIVLLILSLEMVIIPTTSSINLAIIVDSQVLTSVILLTPVTEVTPTTLT